MNRRLVAFATSILVFAFLVPATGSIAARSSHAVGARVVRAICSSTTCPKAPADPFAKADRKYKGQTITYFGGSVGTDHAADVSLAKAFTHSTGIHVKLDEMNGNDSNANITTLQNVFTQHSGSIDVTRLDVVWPGIFGKYLVTLKSALKADVKLEDKTILKNDTVHGKLVAMPYQGDFGLLYYRKDLLNKYHLKAPKTWTQLTSEAKTIQGKQRKSNSHFSGFVFQGNSYEGLTCNALEWIDSYGGGSFITPKGKVTVDNSKAAKALNLAKSWVGTISPKDVTTYTETETANTFLAGNAAFARNWPYMWSLIPPKLHGKVGVAPLPHGPGGKSDATTGGWQIAVNKYSSHIGAAEAWARYYASYPVQIWRAVNAGIAPTMAKVARQKQVKKANAALAVAAKTNHVVRPSTVLGTNYGTGSGYIYKVINSILTKSTSVKSGLSTLKAELKSLHP